MKKTVCRMCFVMVVVCLAVSLAGCAVLDILRASADAEVPNPEAQPESEEGKDVADAPDPANAAADNAAEQPSGEYLACPQPGEQLTLGFDHTLTINYEDANLTHILKSGMLGLVVQEANDQGEVTIASAAPATMPYEMFGVMRECSLELEGSMVASASGYCVDGTVYLTIIEDWQSASGQMACDDGSIPFMIPAPGPRVHEGADGAGEVFHLVAGSQGFTSMRPFQEGTGYHTWTLYTTQVDSVPLTP